ncbi:hypothetical protein WICMUC_005797 [Wickerhamomyces mucosus]|uniref:Uncharacterized protein n=1 Tax=Wickerhamomyces mucosus TaxID=1378264 RepID=A0A9P8P3B2_9ASCO|nr:hypothetical protein WICMUC_005797 [Wickerhamomyces mucosus]
MAISLKSLLNDPVPMSLDLFGSSSISFSDLLSSSSLSTFSLSSITIFSEFLSSFGFAVISVETILSPVDLEPGIIFETFELVDLFELIGDKDFLEAFH